MQMFSRKIAFSVFLLFALCSSPTAANVCSLTSSPSDAETCTTFDSGSKNGKSLDLSNFGFKNLKRIYVQYSKLNEFPRMPGSAWGSLVELNLAGNEISTYPGDYFTMFWRLAKLDLAMNQLPEMPSFSLRAQANIVYFDVSHNKITSMPDAYLNHFPKLTTLIISGNRILQFSSGTSVGHLYQLRLLHIDRMPCDIRALQVWRQFAKLPRLRAYASNVRIRIGDDNYVSDYPCSGAFKHMSLERLRSKQISDALETLGFREDSKLKALVDRIGSI